MSVMVKALGYYSHKGGTGGLAKLKAHLKYLEHGKEHLNRPEGFDQEREQVSRSEFLSRVSEQPARGVIAHKLVFSLSQDERDRRGIDMRELVRDTMADFERATGRNLRWVGFEHEDKGHPHVHVVVAGYDRDGKQVGIYPKELKELARLADRQKDRLCEWSRVTGLSRQERAQGRDCPRWESDYPPDRVLRAVDKVREVIRHLLSSDRTTERSR